MRIGVPQETAPGENRVALVPDTVERLVKSGLEVAIQAGAGEAAFYADAEYQAAGAALVADSASVFAADLVLKVQKPRMNEALGRHEVDLMRSGAALVSFLQPQQEPGLLARLAERGVTAFSMEMIPRISRAQKMDALSSMSTLAGYKAVLLGAAALPRFFPLLMTAAGTIPPAKVLVVGAGVAGLQAIATARRLGAVVEAFDVRPKVREEVQSLGAAFLTVETEEPLEGEGGYAREVTDGFLQRERERLREVVRQVDVVVSTAMVPGKRAPVLITAEMVASMRRGSVIVDLAAEMGGNCELTDPGREGVHHGVRVIGAVNLASTMSYHASRMYSRNLASLLALLVREGRLHLAWDDEITAQSCVTHEGRVRLESAPTALAREGH